MSVAEEQNITYFEDRLSQSIDRLSTTAADYLGPAEVGLLNEAAAFGRAAHQGQVRASGEPYFEHPVAVAQSLVDKRLDHQTLITALLHDTIEDCDVTHDQLTQKFGHKVAELVDGVSKISKLKLKSANTKQAENFRKFVLAISEDVRVVIVKLADRLHNMSTISALPDEKRRRIATETMEIYAPLAERMGIFSFQHQLEDLSFEVLQPELRTAIQQRLKSMLEENDETIPLISDELYELVSSSQILCSVDGRQKTLLSIARKMHRKEVNIEQLSDIMAFRVIVPTLSDCYATLGIIHQKFPNIVGRFKDYISAPKRNGYQSIHTAVFGPKNQKIEIQIRTAEMHDLAENGVASHWIYKSSGGKNLLSKQKKAEAQSMSGARSWVRDLTSLLDLSSGPSEFLEDAKLEMYRDQVFCFTPTGEIIRLPKGATGLDFAYAVHSDIGDHCDQVYVNGKCRQLSTELENGDQVRIITDPEASPKSEWENFAKTGRAKSSIRRVCKARNQEQMAALGKSLLLDEFRYRNQNFDEEALTLCLHEFNVLSLDELYVLVGEGGVTKEHVLDYMLEPSARQEQADETEAISSEPQKKPVFVIDTAYQGESVQTAKCCHPLPGDKIIGILTTGLGITVHTKSCSTAYKFAEMPELWVEVEWPRGAQQYYQGRIKAVLMNQPGALGALCSTVSQQAANIAFIQLEERKLNFYTFILDLDVRDQEHLQSIISILRANRFIESVDRYSF